MNKYVKIAAIIAIFWVLAVAIAPTIDNEKTEFRALRWAQFVLLLISLLPYLGLVPTPLRQFSGPERRWHRASARNGPQPLFVKFCTLLC